MGHQRGPTSRGVTTGPHLHTPRVAGLEDRSVTPVQQGTLSGSEEVQTNWRRSRWNRCRGEHPGLVTGTRQREPQSQPDSPERCGEKDRWNAVRNQGEGPRGGGEGRRTETEKPHQADGKSHTSAGSVGRESTPRPDNPEEGGPEHTGEGRKQPRKRPKQVPRDKPAAGREGEEGGGSPPEPAARPDQRGRSQTRHLKQKTFT